MADTSAFIGIAVVALAVYAMRFGGYLLGSRIRRDSVAGRVMDVLPGSALAAVLALSLLQQASLPDLLALLVTVGLFLRTGRTLPSLGCGLAIAVASAHLLA